ncbi:MAG: Outer membrane protein TolC [Candidatus Celerinatantimonas neptuna]|nr:MAG: Outer membrane protein TolC [Candidatus Celerinatantimonas neptuna]
MKLKITSILVAACVGSFTVNSYADDLLQIYQLAQQKDPVLLQAKAKRDASFEKISQSQAALLPQINLTAGYTASTGHNSTDSESYSDLYKYHQSTAGLSLSQSIFSKANWLNLGIAEKTATQQDALYKYQQQHLIVRVATAYFNVLRAIDNLSYVRANKASVARQLEQTKQRYKVGLTPITDVNESQAEYDRTVAQEIQSENTLANSYEALRDIIGIRPQNLKLLNTKLFAPAPLQQAKKFWMNQAIDKNLQLNAERISKQISEQQIDLAKSGHLPTLSLVADGTTGYMSFDKSDLSNYQSGHTNQGTIGLQFSMPLYQGGSVNSQVLQARYNYVQASQALVQTFRTVQVNLYQTYNDVRANLSSIKAYKQTVASSLSALKATEAGFDVGTRTIVDVQDSTSNYYQSKEQLAGARYDYIVNMLTLKEFAGTLKLTDLQSINNLLYQPQDQIPKQPVAPGLNQRSK